MHGYGEKKKKIVIGGISLNFLREQTLFKYVKSSHVKGDITNFNCKSFLEFIKTRSLSSLLASHWLVYSSPHIFVKKINCISLSILYK